MQKLTKNDYGFTTRDLIRSLPVSQEWIEYDKTWQERRANLLKIPDQIQSSLHALPCDFFRKLRLRNYLRTQARSLIDSALPDAYKCATIYADEVRNLDKSIWISILARREATSKK